jgi:hypothetical protein
MNATAIARALERRRARLPFGAPFAVAEVQPNVYRLEAGTVDGTVDGTVASTDAGTRIFLLKWIAADDRLGANEIAANDAWLPAADIDAPPLVATLGVRGGRIACWAWVAGSDLRAEHRGRLLRAAGMSGVNA